MDILPVTRPNPYIDLHLLIRTTSTTTTIYTYGHLFLCPSALCFCLISVFYNTIYYTTRDEIRDTITIFSPPPPLHDGAGPSSRGDSAINTTIPTTTTTKTTTPNTHLIVHVVRVESVPRFVCLRYTCLPDRCSSVSWWGFESYLVPGE